MEKQKQASPSTNYRFKLANRSKQISSFCQFRNQYENFLNANQIRELKEVYQHGICGKNHSGNLVVVDRVGSLKMNEVNKIIDEDSIVAYFNQRLLQISQKILTEKQQIIWVIDLNGKIMQLASKKLFTLLSKIIKNMLLFFPNILFKMYLVNTPMLFDTIWTKISSEIPEETQQKIIMLSEELDLLYEDVDNSQLPEFLGGDLPEEVFLKDSVESSDDNKENEGGDVEKREEESEEQEEFDFASLKQALSSMKMNGLSSVNQTPLNTEADDN